jgi:hypothetical protein
VSRLQPRNRGLTDGVGPRDICLRLALGKPLERFLPLM